jgi:hypothetical protein
MNTFWLPLQEKVLRMKGSVPVEVIVLRIPTAQLLARA